MRGKGRSTISALLAVPLVAAAGVATGLGRDSEEATARALLERAGVSGGLAVVIGCKDGRLLVAIAKEGRFLVHGLDGSPENVKRTREHIRSAGLYGKVSVDLWRGGRLPYADNLANLLVARRPLPEAEILRVLAPGGAALVREGKGWRRIVKPWPKDIDQWTHYLHDPTNNAVAHDIRVGPPFRVHWVCGPKNTRHHDHLASVSVVVSAGGRLFYIVDEAPRMSVLLPPRWSLVCRDAFSGVLLWKRRIERWWPHLWPVKNGPEALPRRLVATRDKVYVTLGLGKPVSALDAATGETVKVYSGTEGTEEILLDGGVLYLVLASDPKADLTRPHEKDILALDARTGKVLWRKRRANPLRLSLTVGRGKVFYWDGEAIICLDAKTGKEVWRHERKAAKESERPAFSAPTVVLYKDVLLCADRSPALRPPKRFRWNAFYTAGGPGELWALSADTGKLLWKTECAEGYHSPVDVFVADGLVWVGKTAQRLKNDFTVGLDPRTGRVVREFDTSRAFQTTMPHHRCHRNKATERFIIMGRTGVEFIDLKTGRCYRHHWVRGTCRFGVLPANGLLYVPPHSCACFIEAKLAGFYALSHEAEVNLPPSRTLERGPAYGFEGRPELPEREEWPTYRHDAERSGHTESALSPDLSVAWEARLGGRLSAPVVAEGKVFVAKVDEHTLCALDARTGREVWRFTAGGRVDSPPTVQRGFVVFGSRDGWVYCLRSEDGTLVWRFRAAPKEKLIVAHDQLESAWPVHGSALVLGDSIYVCAGRSSYLDGGLYLYRLDLRTGKVLASKKVYSRGPEGEQPSEPRPFEMPGALPDILSSDGKLVYMRHRAFDPKTLEDRPARPHLFSPAGFLDDSWWHRTYWIVGTHFYSGYIGWFFAGREVPAGKILTFDEKRVYGFAYKPSFYRNMTGREFHLFAAPMEEAKQPPPDYDRARRAFRARNEFHTKFDWTCDLPLLARAMVLTKDEIYLCGPPERAFRSLVAFEGRRGGRLFVVSAGDGIVLRAYRTDFLPVFDGMASAYGRLYVATTDGRLVCLGPEGRPLSPYRPEEKVKGKPLEPGLVGWWRFDEEEGDVSRDLSGRGNDAEIYGYWEKGRFGHCIRTEGVPGAITIPDDPDFHFGTSDFTIMFWVRPEEWERRLMGKENFPQNWWTVNLLDDGRVELVLGERRALGKTVRARSRSPLPIGKWTHVAFVVDRGNFRVKCYINGKLDSVTEIPKTLTGSLSVEGRDILIPSTFRPLRCLFDELKIYRRALAEEEIQREFASASSRSP